MLIPGSVDKSLREADTDTDPCVRGSLQVAPGPGMSWIYNRQKGE